jgi:hypothetical protein
MDAQNLSGIDAGAGLFGLTRPAFIVEAAHERPGAGRS